MGRYDNIWALTPTDPNSPFRYRQTHPQEIKVYHNNAWISLGDASSNSTRTLYVYNKNVFKRATLNQYTTSRLIGHDAVHPFSMLPQDGFNCCPNGKVQEPFKLIASFEKPESKDYNLFFSGDANNHIEIKWLTAGTVQVNFKKGSVTKTVTSTNAHTEDLTQMFLEVFMNPGSNTVYIILDDIMTSGEGLSFYVPFTHNEVSDTDLYVCGEITISGSQYNVGPCFKWFNTNNAVKGTDNSNYTGLHLSDICIEEVGYK